jgi:hypothetical protein
MDRDLTVSRIAKYTVSVIAIIGIIGLIVAVHIIDTRLPEENLLSDLILNLIAEFIGAILISYAIGRHIEQREEKRWLPARCRLYARLFDIIDGFLIAIIPEEFREVSDRIYKHKYGGIYVIPTIKPLKKEMLSYLPSLIERDIETHGSFDDMPISLARQQLDAILDRSAFLLDHEPIGLLLKLERSFESLSLVLSDIDWTEERSRQVFARSLSWVVSVTVEVRTWLERMLDQYFVVEDVA